MTTTDDDRFGQIIVTANVAGTVVFGITAITAAALFTTVAQWVGAITAMVLFAVGVVTFLWSYYNAVQRSRHEEISVTQLYFLAGRVAPNRVRWRMWAAMVAQVTIALATALARPDGPDGRPGSSLAVGILVPMFGFGLNGLWAAFHGRFAPRQLAEAPGGGHGANDDDDDTRATDQAMTANDNSIDKNADHG